MAKVILKNVRLSFPSLFSTESYGGADTEKYAATFLLDKEAHADQIETLKAAMKAAVSDKWGAKVPKGIKSCLKDGDDVEYDGYAGCMSVKATTKKRPTVIDRDKTPLAEDDDVIYAGCYVNCSVDIAAYENSYGKFCGAFLNGVQFVKDGEAFGTGGGGNVADDFDDLGGDSSSDEVDPFA